MLAGLRLFEGVPHPEVAYTYGQVWTKDQPSLHDGLDLLAPAGTTVLALESGTLRRLPPSTFGNAGAIVITSEADPGKGWLYEHVDDLQVALADNTLVSAGSAIGVVAEALPGGYAHVHLERVSTAPADCNESVDPCPARENPLDAPGVRAMVADTEPPLFLPLAGGDLRVDDPADWVRLHDTFGDVVEPAQAVGKELMVVCRVSDRSTANGKEVAPFNVSLEVDGPGDDDAQFDGPRFDGPIFQKCQSFKAADVVYSPGAPTTKSNFDERELFMVATSRLVDLGDRVEAQKDPWHPTVAGSYELTFRASDRSGNEGTKTVTLVLGP